MDEIRFIFSETFQTLCLVFLGLLAVKAVGGLRELSPAPAAKMRLAAIRGALYAAIVLLVVLGARGVGTGTSAGIHALASEDDLRHSYVESAYSNALRAVQLRPGIIIYWNDLSASKFREGQFESALKDKPVLSALAGGKLDDDTALRFAYCHYFLGQYDQVFPLTGQVIQDSRSNPAPYVLEGMTYMAEKEFARAEQRFLDVLQFSPVQQAAVEGLAHAHFLMGDSVGALGVINQTQKFPFPPEARRRFNALKAFYAH
jgi:hypothetical protein